MVFLGYINIIQYLQLKSLKRDNFFYGILEIVTQNCTHFNIGTMYSLIIENVFKMMKNNFNIKFKTEFNIRLQFSKVSVCNPLLLSTKS